MKKIDEVDKTIIILVMKYIITSTEERKKLKMYYF